MSTGEEIMKPELKNELLQIKFEIQEYSIRHASREINDNIGQLLSSAKMLMGIGFMELSAVPDSLATAEQTIGKAIQDLRSLSKSLNKKLLGEFDLVDSLEAELELLNIAGNKKIQLISEYKTLPLQPEEQVILFGIIQEVLLNAIKHAAKNIVIRINSINDCLELSIEDDGKGFDVEELKTGRPGLRNIEYRVQLLNGRIEWKSKENNRTEIRIFVPFRK